MTDFTPYIPQDRRAALGRNEGLPDPAHGAALMADVTGFTPLAENLARTLGRRRGSEELTTLLNRVYDTFIAEVECWAGSVVGFAGDAMICWFDAKDDDERMKAEVALRAAACALRLQGAMGAFAAVPLPQGGHVALTIRVAVVAGCARRLLVGDPDIQHLDLLAGRLIDRLGRITALAAAGEVLADAATLNLLGPLARAGALRTIHDADLSAAPLEGLAPPTPPAPALPPSTLAEPIAESWVLPAVRARLRAGAAPLLAELRPTSVVMLQFGGIDYDTDPDAAVRLDAFVRMVQRTLARDEGVLVDVMMADRGGYLYAAFGAPVAHEDDAARALRAALAVRAALPAGLVIRVGVSRGTMRVGPYGSASRRTYGVLGDAANLAHRLMSHAGASELLASAEARAGLEEQFAWEALPAIRVKGKAEPVVVYRLLGAREPAHREFSARLQGREEELARLAAAVEDSTVGRPRLLLIEGEPGIGKSRLAAEAARQARGRGFAVLEGAGRSIEQQTPYRAWRDLLAGFFELRKDDAPPVRRAAVLAHSAALAPELAERLPLLNDLVGSDLPPSDLTRELDAQLRAESVDSLVIDLLRARLQRQPLMLVLEDAHWLDTRSWQMAVTVARALVSAGLPLLVLVTCRPLEADHPALTHMLALLRLPGVARLSLSGLGPEAREALAAAALGVAKLPPEAAALIGTRSGGNPLFVEQLAAALHEAGTIVLSPTPDGAAAVLAGDLAAAQSALPDTLQALLLARVDRLPPEQQLTLKVAAVVGPTFLYKPLCHAYIRQMPVDEASIREQLRALAASDITTLEAPEPELAYSFRHILLHEAAYQTLLYAQRCELHGAVAEWYEQTYGVGADAAPYAALLAHHWGRAGASEREAHYLVVAGEHALRAYALPEARTHFAHALERLRHARATPDHAREAALARQLGRVLWYSGDLGEAQLALRQSVTAAQEAGDLAARAEALCYLGRVQTELGDDESARATLADAHALATIAGDTACELLALRYRGIAALYAGLVEEAGASFERGLALARSVGDQSAEAAILIELGNQAAMDENYALAEAQYRTSLAIFEQTNHRVQQAIILANLGELAARRGAYAAARELGARSLAIDRAVGNRHGVMATLNNLGEVACAQGDLSEAVRCFREVLPLASVAGSALDLLYSLQGIARLQLELGEDARAAELVGLALAHPAASDDLRAQAQRLLDLPNPRAPDDPEQLLAASVAATERWLAGLPLSLARRTQPDG